MTGDLTWPDRIAGAFIFAAVLFAFYLDWKGIR